MPRKKPFSNKQKKKQLQVKRERKRGDAGSGPSSRNASAERGKERQSDTSDSESTDVRKCSQQAPPRNGSYDANRYRLQFEKESKDEIEKRKKKAMEKILKPVPETELEIDINYVYPPDRELNFPRRPSWHYGMVREQLLRKEEKSFQEFLVKLQTHNPPGSLSHFEHNLETWRQLWRVLEMSDVVLLIVDIRHPVLQFPPALYHYVTCELQKHVLLVLNKIDLCPAPLVLAWRQYLLSLFPHLHCICFTSHPGQVYSTVLQKKRMRKKATWGQAGGPLQILRACQEITAAKVDLSSWEQKIHRDALTGWPEGDILEEEPESVVMEHHSDVAMEMGCPTEERYKDGVLTLGCIGFPNVGKSSVLNSLVGRKVVSVSRTPGHTKYFQTYYLTPTVKLCDCPGLVFPSHVDKQLQILTGMYPVSQLQEPYTAVGYLCERTPIESILRLKHPSQEEQDGEGQDKWSAWDVCEAWAERRGYKTAKAARNDVYRAANSLLRLAIDGRICLCLRPPGYTAMKDEWECHLELAEVMSIQGRREEDGVGDKDEEEGESSSEPEEERDRDADDDDEDDDEDRDDEDELFRKPAGRGNPKPKLSVNMFSILGENECD